MGFFADNFHKLNLISETDGKGGLRECQLGAYWATMAHFTHSDEAALICMPTGSGKTAVMMLLAFGLKASRIRKMGTDTNILWYDQTS